MDPLSLGAIATYLTPIATSFATNTLKNIVNNWGKNKIREVMLPSK